MQQQDELKREILAFLRENNIMSAAVSEENKPSATILLFYVDDHFNFHFATHKSSYKAQKLLKNPAISLSVWKNLEMLVQVDGIVSEITDTDEKLSIVDKLAASASKEPDFWPPLLRIGGEDYIVFRIKPTWIRKLDMKQDTMTQIDSPFTEVQL
jgi:nitroimidazol reductase NimA-like FMN-containing flavoprotein (pyridoxamine 5'-phosphate oxidase superfamily)